MQRSNIHFQNLEETIAERRKLAEQARRSLQLLRNRITSRFYEDPALMRLSNEAIEAFEALFNLSVEGESK